MAIEVAGHCKTVFVLSRRAVVDFQLLNCRPAIENRQLVVMTTTNPASQIVPPARHAGELKKISLAPFVAVLYAYCAGGPFGFEAMVSTSGPGMALVFILVVPWLFSIPMALAAAEMATAMPVEGGFYRWTRAALGDFWGFQCGWWNCTGTFFMWSSYGLLLALVPVAILTYLGFSQARFNPFHPLMPPARPWREVYGVGLTLALWIYSGYKQVSTVIEEVDDPVRNFPRGLAIVVPLAAISFFFPIAAGLAALGNWQEWQTGYLVTAARQVGGPALEAGAFAAAAACTFVLLDSTVLSVSRVPFTMADDGYLHPSLARLHPRFGTPVRAIVISTMFCSLLAFASVTELIAIYAWMRSATAVLTLLSVWRLRRIAPDLKREFVVPGGKAGLAL